MDWNSPTTKKHIKEAEARGCLLIGAGSNKGNRIYSLPCGHEQEVETGNMRRGNARCTACMNERLNQEADAQGCELLGPGKTVALRLYSLRCGHEQEVRTSDMRIGSLHCRVCIDERLNQEAEAQGCELLSAGRQRAYRLYRLSCRHEQEIPTGAMRAGRFRCQTCVAQKLKQEAEVQGCELIGAGRNFNYRLYALPCGHEQEVSTGNIRDGQFACKTCVVERLGQEAEAQGCELLGAGRKKETRLYKLSCGHEQVVNTGCMRLGAFLCQTCEDTTRTLPSNVYLLHIKVDSDEWLKLGYARFVDLRASKYGLPEGAEVTTVKCLSVATGNEAHAVEADLHKRYKRKRLPPKQMKPFHTKSGFDECYPVTMLETLLAELKNVKQTQAG